MFGFCIAMIIAIKGKNDPLAYDNGSKNWLTQLGAQKEIISSDAAKFKRHQKKEGE